MIKKRRSSLRHKRIPVIIILGPQGSGKGTQADRLAKKYRLAHVEVGGMLRREIRSGSTFGKQIASYIDGGSLVPTPWVVRLLREQFRSIPASRGLVLDGSPRRLREAYALIRLLRSVRRNITHVFFLKISKRETIRRLSLRWVCLRCHRSLIMGKDIRSHQAHCPVCGGPIAQRADDQPKAIAKRLAWSTRNLRPIVRLFSSKKLLQYVNGEQPIARVFRDLDQAYQKVEKHASTNSS